MSLEVFWSKPLPPSGVVTVGRSSKCMIRIDDDMASREHARPAFADAVIHASHYPGAYTEAGLTAVGAFALSVVISYTPVGKQIDRLAEAFLHG